MSEVKYSEAQFNKAVDIITNLPKNGPMQPTTDDQLYVRFLQEFFFIYLIYKILTSVHRTVLPIF